jgi:hypothetical protein
MMKLSDLTKSQYKKVIVDEVELKIKKLTWGELKDFEAQAKKLEVVSTDEDANEADSTIELCKYIFKHFVRDEKEDVAIDEKEIENLPVQFCVKLLETFVASVRGEDADEDAKKN